MPKTCQKMCINLPIFKFTLKMTLNPIFVLIIITHTQVFETIKKHGGQGYLAAP